MNLYFFLEKWGGKKIESKSKNKKENDEEVRIFDVSFEGRYFLEF